MSDGRRRFVARGRVSFLRILSWVKKRQKGEQICIGSIRELLQNKRPYTMLAGSGYKRAPTCEPARSSARLIVGHLLARSLELG